MATHTSPTGRRGRNRECRPCILTGAAKCRITARANRFRAHWRLPSAHNGPQLINGVHRFVPGEVSTDSCRGTLPTCSPLRHAVRLSWWRNPSRSEEHTSELQSREKLVCRLLLE